MNVRPPIAVLVSRFPLITETFILREIIALEREGQPVRLVPMIREEAAVVHEEARPWIDRALYTPWLSPAIVMSVLRAMRRGAFWSLLGWILRGAALHPGTLVKSLMLFPKSVHLAERLKGEGIAHLHAHFATHPATMARVISVLSGIPFSITVHAHDIFVDRSLLREKIRDARLIRAISAFNKRFLESLYPAEAGTKVEVVHVGIETEKYSAAAVSNDEPVMLCIAALKPYKGVPFLVEACRLLAQEGVAFRCDIIGVGPMAESIGQSIAKAGLHARVRMRGALPQHVVAEEIGKADLLVLPSIVAADGQMEGIPVALMEAMAAGKPVVATSLSGIPELVEHEVSGVLVDPANPRSLADALRGLLTDAALRERLGAEGRRKVAAEFELRDVARQLVALFDRHAPALNGEARAILAAVAGADADYGLRAVHRSPDALVLEVSCRNGTSSELIVKRHLARPGQSRPAHVRAMEERRILDRLAHHFAAFDSLGVPRVVSAAASTLAMTRAAGTPLTNVLRASRSGGAGLDVALRGAGAWLDRFQQFEESDGEEALDRLIDRARRDAETAGVRITDRLSRLRTKVSEKKPRAVSHHGDLWPGNVFIDGARVEVIDFEGYGLSLAAHDPTYLLLHVSLYFALRGRERMEVARAGFFDGYARTLDPAELELCRLAVALQLAAKDDAAMPLAARLAHRRVLRGELSR